MFYQVFFGLQAFYLNYLVNYPNQQYRFFFLPFLAKPRKLLSFALKIWDYLENSTNLLINEVFLEHFLDNLLIWQFFRKIQCIEKILKGFLLFFCWICVLVFLDFFEKFVKFCCGLLGIRDFSERRRVHWQKKINLNVFDYKNSIYSDFVIILLKFCEIYNLREQ